MKDFQIGERKIGKEYPTYIIAEMSGNHGQSFEQAVDILKAAKEAGADAIKLQTYTADTITINCHEPPFQIKGSLWDGRNLYELYEEAHTPWEWQPKLKKIADEIGIDCFSSPFDDTAVDFLEDMNVLVHKVASFEMIDTGLLKRSLRRANRSLCPPEWRRSARSRNRLKPCGKTVRMTLLY